MPRRTDFWVGNGVPNHVGTKNGTKYELLYTKMLLNNSLPLVQLSSSELRPAQVALNAKGAVFLNESSLCHHKTCLCDIPRQKDVSLFSFWEMMRKNTLCYEAIEREERRTGRRYDFVSKTRTDDTFVSLSTIRRMVHKKSSNHVLITTDQGACHGGGDWAVMLNRKVAPAYFNMSKEVTCDFVWHYSMSSCFATAENYIWSWVREHRSKPTIVTG